MRVTWGYNLLLMLAMRLLPVLLALRQDGYGPWIDAVLKAIPEILAGWDETGRIPSGEALRAAWIHVLELADGDTVAEESPLAWEE